MNIEYKNILAGIGAGVILVVSLYIGLFTSANELTFTNKVANSDLVSPDAETLCGWIKTYKGTDKRNFSTDITNVVMGDDGNMYVSEKSWINVFNPKDGKWKILLDDQLTNIRDFVVRDGYIYILDEGFDGHNPAVFLKKYQINYTKNPPTMTLISQSVVGGSSIALSKDSLYAYIGIWTTPYIKKIQLSDFSLVKTIDVTLATDQKKSNVQDIDVGSDGNLYVADSGNYLVKVFDPNGVSIIYFGQEGMGDNKLEALTGIIVDQSGNVYVAESTGKIKKFIKDASGNFKFAGYITVFEESEKNYNELLKLAVDSSGKIYVMRGHFTIAGTDDYYGIQKFTQPCLNLKIVKDNNAKNKQNFDFIADFFGVNNPIFTLVDNGTGNNAKDYIVFKSPNTVSERQNKCYALKSVTCVDENGQNATGYTFANNALNIDVVLHNQKMICTFLNVKVNSREPDCNIATSDTLREFNP